VAESIIRRDPLARLDSGDASPRLEQMFTDVRKRLLPSLVRERFKAARSALDEKSYTVAGPALTDARLMIAEVEKLGVQDDGLADLKVLVDGFLQLIRLEAERRPSSPPAAASASVADQPGRAPQGATLAAPPPAAPQSAPARTTPAPTAAAAPATAAGNARIYLLDDEGVSPPVALDQRMPPMPVEIRQLLKARDQNGVLDVTIDETGRVVDVMIRRSLNPFVDSLIVESARGWRYRPAMKDGVPVRFLKTMILSP
jgi:hypothetical protein